MTRLKYIETVYFTEKGITIKRQVIETQKTKNNFNLLNKLRK